MEREIERECVCVRRSTERGREREDERGVMEGVCVI